jgi:cell division protease FtsH
MSDDIHKVTIVPRGRALGFMMSLPEDDRYVLSKDELEDWLKVTLGGRAAEQIVFGRITNGAANDLERATAIARSMVFEWGMGRSTTSQQMRADNYALSEQTKQLRDEEQREITDQAYAEALRLIAAHRHYLDLLANALLEEETLERDQIDVLLKGLEPESDASGKIGVALPQESDSSPSETRIALPQESDSSPSENGHKLDPVLRSDPFTETGDKT